MVDSNSLAMFKISFEKRVHFDYESIKVDLAYSSFFSSTT